MKKMCEGKYLSEVFELVHRSWLPHDRSDLKKSDTPNGVGFRCYWETVLFPP